MSQRTFKSGNLTVITGYDRFIVNSKPVRSLFLIIMRDSSTIFSSRTRKIKNLTQEIMQEKFDHYGINCPPTLFADLQSDKITKSDVAHDYGRILE